MGRMKIQETQNRIRDRLAYLSAIVKGASAMGQTDIHRLCETVICPILGIVLDLPDLRNLNSEDPCFPGIDLGDPIAKVGIQVTARADVSKIRDTIATCIRNSVDNTYPHLRFFVLTEKQKSYRKNFEADLKGKLTFDPKSDILDYKDILKIVSTLRGQKLMDVDRILREDFDFGPTPSEPRAVVIGNCPGWLNLIPIQFPPRLYLGDLIQELRARGIRPLTHV